MKLKLTVEVPEKLRMEANEIKRFIKIYLEFWDIKVLKIKKDKGDKTLCAKIRDNMKWNYSTQKYEFSKELGEELILK